MHVVGIVLGVVVFDDECGTLNDIVVSLIHVGITPPAHADVGHAGFFDGFHAVANNLSGHDGQVFAQQFSEHLLLVGRHVGVAESDGLIDDSLWSCGSANIVGGFVGDPHLFFLFFGAGFEDSASEVFASGENAERASRTGIDECGIRAHHFGSTADDDTVANHKVQ